MAFDHILSVENFLIIFKKFNFRDFVSFKMGNEKSDRRKHFTKYQLKRKQLDTESRITDPLPISFPLIKPQPAVYEEVKKIKHFAYERRF